MSERSRAVLITGCSSGIGRAAAELLADEGWAVYATARRPETIADLEAKGCTTLALDVTDEGSMTRVVERIEAEHGAVGALVNNAGYGLHGAVESTDLDEARRQFETNFFGLVKLTQLVLPGMRRRGSGRIVNISSMGGKLTFPGGGFYHASKHALEAMSDALRYEVRPFGIDVVVIEPGLIKTEFAGNATDTVDTSHEVYGDFNRGVADKIESAYRGPMAAAAAGPRAVAKVIAKAVASSHPRTRYIVTAGARALLLVRRVMPDRLFDAVLRRQYPQPRA